MLSRKPSFLLKLPCQASEQPPRDTCTPRTLSWPELGVHCEGRAGQGFWDLPEASSLGRMAGHVVSQACITLSFVSLPPSPQVTPHGGSLVPRLCRE